MAYGTHLLDEMHLDILKEVGNIGAGNAATSLSKMLERRIDMRVPEVKVISFQEVEKVVGGAETLVAGIYMEFYGEIHGTIIFILDKQSADNLLSLLLIKHEFHEQEGFTDMGISALGEVGNILTGAYLGSLSLLTGLQIKYSVPDMAYDMAGAILSVPMIEFGQVGEQALFIETVFIDGSHHINGNFFLMPSMESYPIILESLGAV